MQKSGQIIAACIPKAEQFDFLERKKTRNADTSDTHRDSSVEVRPEERRPRSLPSQSSHLVNGMRFGGLSVCDFARGIWVDIANVGDVVDGDAPE